MQLNLTATATFYRNRVLALRANVPTTVAHPGLNRWFVLATVIAFVVGATAISWADALGLGDPDSVTGHFMNVMGWVG